MEFLFQLIGPVTNDSDSAALQLQLSTHKNTQTYRQLLHDSLGLCIQMKKILLGQIICC